jgi:hypothetical protein
MRTRTMSHTGWEGGRLHKAECRHSSATSDYISGAFASQPLACAGMSCDVLGREGISPKSLNFPTPIRTNLVAFLEDRFELGPYVCGGHERKPAYLILVNDKVGCAIDIVAWSPEDGRIATWCHRAWAIGQDCVYRPRLTEHGGLRVWRTPQNWLRSGREGIVPLRKTALPYQLDCAGPLIAEDTAHGLELKSQLSPPIPRILLAAADGAKA